MVNKGENLLQDLRSALMLRQGDAKVFQKYSQMKREALDKINRQAHEQRGF